MIEQGFNHTNSTIKEMTDFFENRVDTLKPKEGKKYLQQLSRKISRKGNEKTPIPVL